MVRYLLSTPRYCKKTTHEIPKPQILRQRNEACAKAASFQGPRGDPGSVALTGHGGFAPVIWGHGGSVGDP